MSNVKPLITVYPWSPTEWAWSGEIAEGTMDCQYDCFGPTVEVAHQHAEKWLLELCACLGIRDTPSLRKRISKAVVIEVQT